MDRRIHQAEVVEYDISYHLMSERFKIDTGGQGLPSPIDRVRIRYRQAPALCSRFALDKIPTLQHLLVPVFYV